MTFVKQYYCQMKCSGSLLWNYIVIYAYKPNLYSWRCDRILWYGRGLHQLSYVRGESRFSDHRPVYSMFLAEVESISCNQIKKSSSSRIEVEDLFPHSHGYGYTDLHYFWWMPTVLIPWDQLDYFEGTEGLPHKVIHLNKKIPINFINLARLSIRI